MQRRVVLATCFMLLIALVKQVEGSDGSATDQFLGSPLLILGTILVIDVLAFAYHKIRK